APRNALDHSSIPSASEVYVTGAAVSQSVFIGGSVKQASRKRARHAVCHQPAVALRCRRRHASKGVEVPRINFEFHGLNYQFQEGFSFSRLASPSPTGTTI